MLTQCIQLSFKLKKRTPSKRVKQLLRESVQDKAKKDERAKKEEKEKKVADPSVKKEVKKPEKKNKKVKVWFSISKTKRSI